MSRKTINLGGLLLVVVWSLFLSVALSACGETATATNTSNSTSSSSSNNNTKTQAPAAAGAIPGDGGAATSNAAKSGVDTYASYTPQQVIDTFLKAYAADDFATCKALIAPMSSDWRSPDEFDLNVKAMDKKGKLVVTKFGLDEDEGSKVFFFVDYHRVPSANQPTPTQGVRLGDAEQQDTSATSIPLADSFTDITLERVNNSWKIESWDYI